MDPDNADVNPSLDAWERILRNAWMEFYEIKAEWAGAGARWTRVQDKAERLWGRIDVLSLELREVQLHDDRLSVLRDTTLELRMLLTWYVRPEATPATRRAPSYEPTKAPRRDQVAIGPINSWIRRSILTNMQSTKQKYFDCSALVYATHSDCPVLMADYMEHPELLKLTVTKPPTAYFDLGIPPGLHRACDWATLEWPHLSSGVPVDWPDFVQAVGAGSRYVRGHRETIERLVEWAGTATDERHFAFFYGSKAARMEEKPAIAGDHPRVFPRLQATRSWRATDLDVFATVHKSEAIAVAYMDAGEIADHIRGQSSDVRPAA